MPILVASRSRCGSQSDGRFRWLPDLESATWTSLQKIHGSAWTGSDMTRASFWKWLRPPAALLVEDNSCRGSHRKRLHKSAAHWLLL